MEPPSADLGFDERVHISAATYSIHARDLLKALADIGYDVQTVQDLVRDHGATGRKYEAAVPILTAAFPTIAYEPLREDIIRTLAVPWAQEATPALLEEFRSRPADEVTGPSLRYAVGLAVSVTANDDYVEELLELAMDRKYGEARAAIVEGLGRFGKHPKVGEAVVDLLDDPAVEGSAIRAAGRLKLRGARARLVKFLHHDDSWIRQQAKSAIAKIDRARAAEKKGE